MRAARLLVHGSPPVVESVASPEPGADEVLVEMAMASLNPVDLRLRDGEMAETAPLPRIPGLEGVGTSEGRLVLVSGEGRGLSSDGTLAERLSARRSELHAVPDGVDPAQAVCCGVVGRTAVRVVDLARPDPTDRVLILGASGSVGLAICQLLKGRIETSIAQIRSPAKAGSVRDSGGEPIAISSATGLHRAIEATAPTIILDGLGGAWTSAALASAGARTRLVIFGASAGVESDLDVRSFYRRSLSIRGYSGTTEDPATLREAVEAALAAVAEGRLRFRIGARIPLEEIATAYRRLESGTDGKILVDLAAG